MRFFLFLCLVAILAAANTFLLLFAKADVADTTTEELDVDHMKSKYPAPQGRRPRAVNIQAHAQPQAIPGRVRADHALPRNGTWLSLQAHVMNDIQRRNGNAF
mgnify:CR=1 FL=1